MFDHQLHFKSGVPEFKPWADTVPSFTYSKAVPYFQVSLVNVQGQLLLGHLNHCVIHQAEL